MDYPIIASPIASQKFDLGKVEVGTSLSIQGKRCFCLLYKDEFSSVISIQNDYEENLFFKSQ